MSNVFVRKLTRLGALTPDARAAIEDVTANPWTVSAKTDLIREGDRPSSMLVILDGKAFRYKVVLNGTRQIMAFLMPGDAFDLHSNFLEKMDHSIQTATDACVAAIAFHDLESLMTEHPTFARAMYLAKLADEARLRAWIVNMGRRSCLERAAHIMCELYTRAHSIGLDDPSEVLFPLPQAIMADALGMTPVHFNRVLRELIALKLVSSHRGRIQITSPQQLASLAGFDDDYLF